MKEKLKKIKIPEMNLKKMKIFWISSLGILAGTLLFNVLGFLGWIFQLIANIFYLLYWTDIILVILVIFKFSNRENDTGQLIIIFNYVLCIILFLIIPIMGLNTLLLGVLPHTGFTGSTLEFSLLQIGQIAWTYIIMGCSLGLTFYIFISMRKDESIWSI